MTLEQKKALIDMAKKASLNAYAPYSGFCVGCCLLAESGRTFVGVNVENSAFGSTICAERVALCSAVSAGEKVIRAIAIYNDSTLPNPCGACLRVIAELAPSAEIIVATKGDFRTYSVDGLMPCAFKEKERLQR